MPWLAGDVVYPVKTMESDVNKRFVTVGKRKTEFVSMYHNPVP